MTGVRAAILMLSLLAVVAGCSAPTKTTSVTFTGSPAANSASTIVLEDCGHVTYGADGTVGPLRCPDGNINMTVDHIIRDGFSYVAKLGPDADPETIATAICKDFRSGQTTGPIELEIYQLVKAESHWGTFGVDPLDDAKGLCPAYADEL